MKIVKSSNAQTIRNSDTSKLLEYSIGLNEKDIDFCINTINCMYQKYIMVITNKLLAI